MKLGRVQFTHPGGLKYGVKPYPGIAVAVPLRRKTGDSAAKNTDVAAPSPRVLHHSGVGVIPQSYRKISVSISRVSARAL